MKYRGGSIMDFESSRKLIEPFYTHSKNKDRIDSGTKVINQIRIYQLPFKNLRKIESVFRSCTCCTVQTWARFEEFLIYDKSLFKAF